jgi:hypothetical protein
LVNELNDNLGYIKRIIFDPTSGTVDLNTLTMPCLYYFAGAVPVSNWTYSTLTDVTMLSTGGDRAWQCIFIGDGTLYFRVSPWDGTWLPWYKIAGVLA